MTVLSGRIEASILSAASAVVDLGAEAAGADARRRARPDFARSHRADALRQRGKSVDSRCSGWRSDERPPALANSSCTVWSERWLKRASSRTYNSCLGFVNRSRSTSARTSGNKPCKSDLDIGLIVLSTALSGQVQNLPIRTSQADPVGKQV